MDSKKFPDDYTSEELASIEEAALKSVANMGSPEFDRIVDSGDGRTLLMKGRRLSMIIDMPFEQLTAYIRHNYIR